MAAGAVANLAVLLTAKTGRFAADMNRAHKPLLQLQSTARTVQRGVRLAFSVVLARGFVSTLRQAVMRAGELGVRIDRVSRMRIHGLVRSYQALGHVMTRLGVRIASMLAPTLEKMIDTLGAATIWIEQRLTPAALKNALTTAKWGAAVLAAVSAMGIAINVIVRLQSALKGVAIAQAAVQAFSGPKGWAVLAVGAAAFGATVWGVNKAFKALESDATDNLEGLGKQFEALKSTMRGLGAVGFGRVGADFVSRSMLSPSGDISRMWAAQLTAADAIAKQTALMEQHRREDVAQARNMSWGDGWRGAGRMRG